MPNNPSSRLTALLTRLQQVGVTFLSFTSSKSFRYVFIFLACVAAGILFYIYAWRVFQQEVGLPPGVVERDPRVNTTLLQDLNDKRVKRSEHRVTSYGTHNGLFGIAEPPLEPTPAVSPFPTEGPLSTATPAPSVSPDPLATPTPENSAL